MAVLRGVQRRPPRAAASLVRTVRRALAQRPVQLRGVPAFPDRSRPRTVRVRGPCPCGRAPSEVPRGPGRRPGARCRNGDLRASRAPDRCRHVGSAREAAQGRARLRPGQGARGRRRRAGGLAGLPVAAAGRRDRSPSQAERHGSSRRDARIVRAGAWRGASESRAARRRRAHHGGDGRRMRGDVAGQRLVPCLGARGRPRAPARGPTCLYSGGPSSGSVVARG